jgi:chaperonin GroES
MQGDKLAQGAKSAQFSAGHAKKDDPVEFHGTVAVVEDTSCSTTTYGMPRGPITFGTGDGDAIGVGTIPAQHRYEPLNDKVLMRRVVETSEKQVIQPDAFEQKSNKGEVVALAFGICPNLSVGDVVLFGEYSAEEIELDGEKFVLSAYADIKLKLR